MPLPFLAGSAAEEPKEHYGRTSTFNHVNGYSVPKPGPVADAQPISDKEMSTLRANELKTTYGDRVGFQKPAAAVMPAYVQLDKKVLFFKGYMKQTVHESAVERYRVRLFNVYYYLEDDTVSMSEPEIENSGMVHGTFLSRQHLPLAEGKTVHWTDLNVGINLNVYGRVIRLYGTNESTKTFLEREGIVVGESEDAPEDPYKASRRLTDRPSVTHETPSEFDKLKQFLVLDRKVLRFYTTWEDPNDAGNRLKAEVFFFLVDETVEVREIHSNNDGRDPFPVLLRRQKVPRNHHAVPMDFASSVFEISDAEVEEYIGPEDFAIGTQVNIFGRVFFVYDLDEFTMDFYRRNFGVEAFEPIDVSDNKPPPPVPEIPPYNGIGSPEDSYLSCVSINPKAALGSKSLLQLLKYENQVLRFEAVPDLGKHPDDNGRKFVISYRLADDQISIYEPPIQNSGIQGGMLLAFQQVTRSGCNPDKPEYLKAADFFVGAEVEIFKRFYKVTSCDLFVLKYMDQHAGDYTPSQIAETKAALSEVV